MELIFTAHATLRMAQRGISKFAVMVTMLWGTYVKIPHCVKMNGRKQVRRCHSYKLTAKGVKKAERAGYDIAVHEGTTVIVTQDETRVVTVYRER